MASILTTRPGKTQTVKKLLCHTKGPRFYPKHNVRSIILGTTGVISSCLMLFLIQHATKSHETHALGSNLHLALCFSSSDSVPFSLHLPKTFHRSLCNSCRSTAKPPVLNVFLQMSFHLLAVRKTWCFPVFLFPELFV